MPTKTDLKKTKEKAVDFAHAAKTVLQQMAMVDGTPEAMEAFRLLSNGLTQSIPDSHQQPALEHANAA